MPSDEVVMPTLTSDTAGKLVPEQAAERVSAVPAPHQYAWRGSWVVAAHGSYDMQSITPLAEALGTAAKKHPKVILDASGVTFADSTLLNLLILTHQTGTLRVVAPSPQLQRLCEITGVDNLLEIRDTVDEAAVS
ncbi:STAS domain-containing protein [Streptomyces sp. NPDC006372]|uniref:STAS domain-containing protein n=1 Tax=Streptomyces sp. NPDC006372 TaxID=3155599 RepID=UPI0033B6EB20